MKHIQKFEKWTTNVTDDYDIKYNDNDTQKLSDIVIYTENFLRDNIDNLSFENERVQIKNDIIDLIYVSIDSGQIKNIYQLNFHFKNGKYPQYTITEYEYKYLRELIYELKLYLRKRYNDKFNKDLILNEIDPVKRKAKNYNL